MPNWCSGVLKIRGRKKDIINFLNNEIERYGWPRDEKNEHTKYPLDVQIDEYGDIFCKATDDEHNSWLYFKDSKRLFISENIEWYFSDGSSEKEVKCLDIRQAWYLDAKYFARISKKYNLDFKAMAFESGEQFTREFEVVDGNTVLDQTIHYGENYDWDVYDPRLGG